MANIGGAKRESVSFENTKYVGLFEAEVIAVNPSVEDYKEILGIDLPENSKATEYLGESQDKKTTLRIDIWLEEYKTKNKFKTTFFLENKEKVNKDATKKQYINNVGVCSWADDANNLPEWFAKRDYRVAFVGEEELYNFMRTWLSRLDYRQDSTVLELEWKSLMKGNVSGIREQVQGEYCDRIVAMATVKTVEKEGEVKEYQSVYNKAFLPSYGLKAFRLLNYDSKEIQSSLKGKKSKDLKSHERFVLNIIGEYGCRDFYIFKDVKEYNADDNLVASDAVISTDGDDY